jgi:hypothetical protein
MNFLYRSEQIGDIVNAPKVLRRPELLEKGQPLPFSSYGERGKRIDLWLDLKDSRTLIDLRLHVRAAVFDAPEMFEATLILASERVRGIGWNPTGKKRFYGKQIIPKGWHQNVIDPNLAPNHSDKNRHLPLRNFEPTDLAAFFTATAELWHIDLPIEESLL